MAIGTGLALGLGATALGGYLNARNQNKQAKRQDQYGQQTSGMLQGMMQQGPSVLEQAGMGMLGAGGPQAPQVAMPGYNPQQFDLASILQSSGFNNGQDGLMQMLRTDPMAKSQQALGGIVQGQGNAFDNTDLFKSLGIMDQRATDNAVAQTRAGSSGLGQRFGSYMARQEGDMRLQANDSAAARNAGIAMQSHGDAQTRLLQALGMMQGGEQFGAQNQLAAAQALQQGGLGAGQLGLAGVQGNNDAMAQLAQLQQGAGIANQGAALQGQQSQADILQMLLGAQGQRQGQNMQLAGMAAGAGAPVGQPGYGDLISGLGQTGMLMGMMGQQPPPRDLNTIRKGGRKF